MVVKSFSGVMTGVVVTLEFVALVKYFVEVFSDVVVKMLTVCIDIEVLARGNVKVSAAVITALEFPMPIP